MKRILVVEDDPDSRELQHAMLEGSGYEVSSAENGKKALELLADCSIDAIISDILMPEMDGFELCRIVKSNASLRHIPFIFYTATYTSPDDRLLARDSGADRYLIKPMDPTLFLNEIQAIIDATPSTPHSPVDGLPERHVSTLLRKLWEKTGKLKFTGSLLQTTTERYSHLINTLHKSYFIYLYDQHGNLTYVSPSAAQLLRCNSDEELRQRMLQIAGGPLAPDAEPREIIPAPQDVNVIEYEVEIPSSEGGGLILEVTETPIIGVDEQSIEVQGIAHDITDRRRLEQEHRLMEKALAQAQKMEAIGNMASGIAHDFNNMLMTIMGYAELLQSSALEDPEEVPSLGQEIMNAGQRASHLIKQMLSLARHTDVPLEPGLLQSIVADEVSLLNAALPKSIRLQLSLDESSPAILVDENAVIQVLMNLCINAAHAIGDDTGTICISVSHSEEDQIGEKQHFVDLCVKDTGCGMSKETRDRLFEPFFSTKHGQQGTGLGMVVVQGIVQRHGGSIDVSSELGKGTTVRIRFPAQPSENLADASDSMAMRLHILLTGYSTASIEFIASALTILNHQVTQIQSLEDALTACEASSVESVSAVLLQCYGEEEAEKHASAFRRLLADTPIIAVLPPSLQEEHPTKMVRTDFGVCLRRPFTASDLQACLLDVCHKRVGP